MFKNMFKKANMNAYDIDTIINNLVKKIDNKEGNEKIIKGLISTVSSWYIIKAYNASLNLYGEEDMLKLASEKQKDLLNIFNANDLLNEVASKDLIADYYTDLVNNHEFSRDIYFASLLRIIDLGGADKGAEYGLVFAKTFNYDLAIPMRYASYDSNPTNPRLSEFVSKYLELGGNKNVYWLSNYFDEDPKSRYCMEELGYVISCQDVLNAAKKNGKRID